MLKALPSSPAMCVAGTQDGGTAKHGEFQPLSNAARARCRASWQSRWAPTSARSCLLRPFATPRKSPEPRRRPALEAYRTNSGVTDRQAIRLLAGFQYEPDFATIGAVPAVEVRGTFIQRRRRCEAGSGGNWTMLRIVAGLGALLHLGFAYKETFGWGPSFVSKAAPAWLREPDAQAHIAWAQKLAFNVGAYNLVLAIGLAWTAVSDVSMTGSLGMFFTLWLLIAAAAAAYTGVACRCCPGWLGPTARHSIVPDAAAVIWAAFLEEARYHHIGILHRVIRVFAETSYVLIRVRLRSGLLRRFGRSRSRVNPLQSHQGWSHSFQSGQGVNVDQIVLGKWNAHIKILDVALAAGSQRSCEPGTKMRSAEYDVLLKPADHRVEETLHHYRRCQQPTQRREPQPPWWLFSGPTD